MTTILAIETSCDETAAAIVDNSLNIHANTVASQINLHAPYGGVFPELASRAHAESISAVVNSAMNEASMTYSDIDAIAVTQGPGLVGSLLVGINFAKGLSLATGKPLLAINHLEGHVYSLWLSPDAADIAFPAMNLIVSGGHTELVLMRSHGDYQRLGGTIDDAAGEAFDKVGRLLGLPFPGGPAIEAAAKTGDPSAYRFPRARVKNPCDFSFSGLKTAVMRAVTVQPSQQRRAQLRHDVNIPDVAAAFQAALIDALTTTTARAAQQHQCREIHLSGGVSANQSLRSKMQAATTLKLRYPPPSLCTDNAAMIAAAASFRYQQGLPSPLDFEARPSWPLSCDTYAES